MRSSLDLQKYFILGRITSVGNRESLFENIFYDVGKLIFIKSKILTNIPNNNKMIKCPLSFHFKINYWMNYYDDDEQSMNTHLFIDDFNGIHLRPHFNNNKSAPLLTLIYNGQSIT